METTRFVVVGLLGFPSGVGPPCALDTRHGPSRLGDGWEGIRVVRCRAVGGGGVVELTLDRTSF